VAQDKALLAIRTLEPALVIQQLSAFDRVGNGLRDPCLASALVRSGRPEVEVVFLGPEIEALLQRPVAELLEDGFGYELAQSYWTWQDANETWRCLTSRR
jgi:hypothetical protein